MPPNRKTDLSAQDFASLNVAHLRALKIEHAPQQQAPQQQQQQQQSPNYWDWPVDEQVEEIQCLDTTRIESNLQKDAQQRLTTKHETVRSQSQSVKDPDSYWDMPTLPKDVVPPRTTPRRPNHHPAPAGQDMTNYWDDVSSDDYWNDPSHSHYHVKPQKQRPVPTHHPAPANLDKESYWNEAPVTSKVADSDAYWNDPAESHDQPSYWDWPVGEQDEKERLLQITLEHERARRLTSTHFLEKQLLEQAAQRHHHAQKQVAAAVVPTALVAAHDDYWAC